MSTTRILGIILLTSFLLGCGVSRVVPDSNGKPLSIAESGYTSNGCIKNLKVASKKLDVKIKNIVVDDTTWGTTAKILMWPFVKGTICTAEVE